MVKPPLAWWRGQRILTDRDHNLEAIDPGGMEETAVSPMYNLEVKIPLMVSISLWLLFSYRYFTNILSKRATSFHTRAKFFELNFFIRKTLLPIICGDEHAALKNLT